tara:strand:+ start:1147 stop:1581 length:435 start_codon:yes stop_codon:yes gene_type:complete
MSFKYMPAAGLNNVGSYMVSGRPYLTGSDTQVKSEQVKVEFPNVTQKIKIDLKSCDSGDVIRVHFTPQSGAGSNSGATISNLHYWTLTEGESLELNVKCKEVYISTPSTNHATTASKWQLCAELTNIPATSMYDFTEGDAGITE